LDVATRKPLPRAAQLYVFDERRCDSPFVEKVWRDRGVPARGFISVAVTHWEMVVTKERGRTYLTVGGPETAASVMSITTGDGEFVGIQFGLGTFMPSLPLTQLVDRALTLPEAGGGSFWLNGSAWQFPDFENADAFVGRMEREGLLVRDPVVKAA